MSAYQATVTIGGRTGRTVIETANIAHAAKLAIEQALGDGDEPREVQVSVTGDIHLGEWKKQDGTTGYSLDLIASRVEAIGPKQDGAAPQQRKPKPAQEPDTAWVDEEEDPFGDQ